MMVKSYVHYLSQQDGMTAADSASLQPKAASAPPKKAVMLFNEDKEIFVFWLSPLFWVLYYFSLKS